MFDFIVAKGFRNPIGRNGETGRQRIAVLLTIILGAALAVSFAQLPVATILGSVKDASGAVVPEAKLTAKNVETGQTRTAVSEGDGSYRFSALPVGNYEVRAEHPGFQTGVRSGLILAVGQEALVNITLQLGAVEQTVAVTAEAPLVNTTSGSLGGLVDEQKVADLPLNGRNYSSLTLLQTGVQQANNNRGSTGGPQTSGIWYSSNGAPPRSNNFLLDGAIMQTSNDTGSSGVSQLSLGIDGIREWRVVTNSFSADYGMTMGSQVVIVSKGGTNQFHGSAFEYLRNSALDARNFFDYKTAATPARLPAFRRNNFGGSFGGPIKKDKTFFYGVFEALRERLGITTVSSTIPMASRASASISPVIQPFLPLFPLPNLPNSQFTFPYSQPTSENYGQMRVDHTISASDNTFGRYTIDDAQQVLTQAFPEFREFRGSRFQYATWSENHIFSPVLLNTARFSFSRTVVAATTPSGISGPQFSFVPGQETGNISIGGVSGWGGGATDPSTSKQNIFTLSDDLFYTHGRHSFKFGSLFNHYQFYKQTGSLSRGQLSFASVTTFLAAAPTSVIAVTPGSILDRTYHYNTLGFYAQDDVRMSPTLTLNLGLRYEFNTTWHEVRGHGSALRSVLKDAAFTLGDPFVNPSLKNFGPRLGFAWDVMGNGKTAVRGGGGLLYDVGNWGPALGANETATPPFSSSSTILTPPTLTSLPLVFPPSAAGKSVRVLDYHTQQPHSLQYNLTLEQQLPYRMALTVAYAGSRGFNLPQLTDGNPTVPTILPDGRPFWTGTEPRMNPNWTSVAYNTASGDSWYNSMQVGLLKSLSNGLQFQSSFTWSKLLDDTQAQNAADTNTNGSGPVFPARPSLDRAPADFDSTLNWRFNAIYHLPDLASRGGVPGKLLNGWWTTGILALQSGFPYDPRVQANISRSLESDRPDLVAGRNSGNISSGTTAGCPGVASGQRLGTPNLYYDPCAFTLQAPGFLGTAGRNIMRGPHTADLDFSLVKDTAIRMLGESGKLEFRAEVFNILNHPNFGDPSVTVFAGTGVTTPLANAGIITRTAVASRQIQLALKILF